MQFTLRRFCGRLAGDDTETIEFRAYAFLPLPFCDFLESLSDLTFSDLVVVFAGFLAIAHSFIETIRSTTVAEFRGPVTQPAYQSNRIK